MNIPHADIKIPWEFARMQHVTQMAIYASKIKINTEPRWAKIIDMGWNPKAGGEAWQGRIPIGRIPSDLM